MKIYIGTWFTSDGYPDRYCSCPTKPDTLDASAPRVSEIVAMLDAMDTTRINSAVLIAVLPNVGTKYIFEENNEEYKLKYFIDKKQLPSK